MKQKKKVIIPPIESQCTLKQACEYIAFGWEPRTKANEQLCDRMEYVRSNNYAFLTHADAFGSPIIPPDDNPYNWQMTKALNVLYTLIKSGAITATGIADPALPDWTEHHSVMNENIHKHKNYDPKEYNKRTTVILPDEWELDVIYNWIVAVPTQPHYQTSYRDVKINFTDLQNAHPIKHHTVTLTDDGCLCVNDGTTTTIIRKLRPGSKRYEWMKFYTDHPYQTISKKDLDDKFRGDIYEIRSTDKMCHCIFVAFEEYPELRAACFPIANTKEVYFRPTVTDADIHPL